jgi:hypothetical protein
MLTHLGLKLCLQCLKCGLELGPLCLKCGLELGLKCGLQLGTLGLRLLQFHSKILEALFLALNNPLK